MILIDAFAGMGSITVAAFCILTVSGAVATVFPVTMIGTRVTARAPPLLSKAPAFISRKPFGRSFSASGGKTAVNVLPFILASTHLPPLSFCIGSPEDPTQILSTSPEGSSNSPVTERPDGSACKSIIRFSAILLIFTVVFGFCLTVISYTFRAPFSAMTGIRTLSNGAKKAFVSLPLQPSIYAFESFGVAVTLISVTPNGNVIE